MQKFDDGMLCHVILLVVRPDSRSLTGRINVLSFAIPITQNPNIVKFKLDKAPKVKWKNSSEGSKKV